MIQHKLAISLAIGKVTLMSILFIVLGSMEAMAYQVFDNPRIRNRHVDRCTASWVYPDGCSQNATAHVATEFCKVKGYSYSSYSKWRDYPRTDEYRRDVVKLVEEGNPVRRSFQDRRGAWIFKMIICE